MIYGKIFNKIKEKIINTYKNNNKNSNEIKKTSQIRYKKIKNHKFNNRGVYKRILQKKFSTFLSILFFLFFFSYLYSLNPKNSIHLKIYH